MKKTVFIIVFFIAVYFTVRLPFLIEPLGDEEGTHSFVFCCNPPAPNYLWKGRINGQDQFDPPQHPALIYETLMAFGTPWSPLIEANRRDHPLRLVLIIRSAFTLFQFSYFLVLLLILLNRSEDAPWRERLVWVAIVLSVAQIAISTSVSVQVDGSLGSLLPGLVVLSLLAYHDNLFPSKWSFVALFASSLFLGFGKNEWGLALLASLILTGVLIFFARSFYQEYDGFLTDCTLLGAVVAGLMIGNLINYLFDSKNYLDGLYLMRGLSRYKNNVDTISMLMGRVKYLYLNILMIMIVGVGGILAARKKVDAILFLIFIWGGILFFAYFITQWGWALQRYYAPSFVVLVAGVMVASKYYSGRAAQYIFAALIAISLIGTSIYTGRRMANLGDYSRLFTPPAASQEQAQSPDSCVPLVNDGEAFANGANEFISRSVGEVAGAELASQFGKAICK